MISVTIIAKDAEETLKKCLESVQDFSEVVLVDTGSKDKTMEIAKQFSNVVVYQKPFTGFGPLHNSAAALAKGEWILSLDSDEVLSDEAKEAILHRKLDPEVVYTFSFKNYFGGRWVKSCGWYPEVKKRLYHKQHTSFTETFVHEAIIAKGRVEKLPGEILHYSYRSIDDFLVKMSRYSDLFLQDYEGRRSSTLWKAIGKSWFAFFRSYILKRGFLQGRVGYIISRYQADVAYYKYLKLAYHHEVKDGTL